MADSNDDVLLSVRRLTVDFLAGSRSVRAVNGVDLQIRRGERLAIVGESGSGKTVTATALMGMAGRIAQRVTGSVTIGGVDMVNGDEVAVRKLRGRRVALIPQDPINSLSPVRSIGAQLTETIRAHFAVPEDQAVERAVAALTRVGLPMPREHLSRYPFELSGGMMQRVLIAMAIACEPDVLIADEATTALDVSVQAQVLELFDSLVSETGMALIFITHDLTLVAGLAERIVVMYGGEIVERGLVADVFNQPRHPYTAALLSCRLDGQTRADGPAYFIAGRPPDISVGRSGCPFESRCALAIDRCAIEMPTLSRVTERSHEAACFKSGSVAGFRSAPATGEVARIVTASAQATGLAPVVPVLEARSLKVSYRRRGSGLLRRRQHALAVDGIDLRVDQGRTLGIVGESGCGKSSAARALLRLQPASKGSIKLDGDEIGSMGQRRLRSLRPRMQLILQNSGGAFDPRRSVRGMLHEALAAVGVASRQRDRHASELLAAVELPDELLDVLPAQLSGGQRQRLSVARALAGKPRLIVADEPTSALDVSLRGQVLNLLTSVQRRLDAALLVISHDLAVIRYLSDDVAVMYLGKIVEVGPVNQVFGDARHPYTRALLATASSETIGIGVRPAPIRGDVPSLFDPPDGCVFHPRCPRATDRCRLEVPVLRVMSPAHQAACHYAEDPGPERPWNDPRESLGIMSPGT